MVSRIVVILGLLAGSCFGQSGSASTSVYVQIYSNSQTIAPSAVVPNIGQIGHQVFLAFSNAPSQTCTTQAGTSGASLQFSYDRTNWQNFGNPTAPQAVAGNAISFFGGGNYPFVRFNIALFDNIHCMVNGFYTGTSNSSTTQPPVGTIGSFAYSQLTGISNIPFNLTGGLANQGVYPIYACDRNAYVSQSGQITLANTSGSYVAICSVAATAISGNATFQLIVGSGTNCSGFDHVISPVFQLVQGVPFTLGSGLGKVMDFTSGTITDNICVVTTGPSPVAIMITYTLL